MLGYKNKHIAYYYPYKKHESLENIDVQENTSINKAHKSALGVGTKAKKK